MGFSAFFISSKYPQISSNILKTSSNILFITLQSSIYNKYMILTAINITYNIIIIFGIFRHFSAFFGIFCKPIVSLFIKCSEYVYYTHLYYCM